MQICGEADDASSAFDSVMALCPDIVVLDMSMKGAGGVEVLKGIRQAGIKVPVLVLSIYDEMVHAVRVLRAGANGYIMKQEATEKILIAVRRILGGDVYVSDRVAKKMLTQVLSPGAAKSHSGTDKLTDRELQVFRLIGQGFSTRQIAGELLLSVKTIETYQSHIKEKMGLTNSRALLQHAIQWVMSQHEMAHGSQGE